MAQGGALLIALAHEETMASASPSLIGFPWASADGFRRSLGRSQLLLRGTLPWFEFFPCVRIPKYDRIPLARAGWQR
jgi:hypothetical protein